MNEKEPYVPIADRLNQDVWHDNFVPKYSALSNVRPSLLVLVGVWMLFAPTAIGSACFALSTLVGSDDLGVRLILLFSSVAWSVLIFAILLKQTKRYLDRDGAGDSVDCDSVDCDSVDCDSVDCDSVDCDSVDGDA
ncbi:hypothetical protein CA13_08770 [Planctomycetes bacterium CA13]|uniref:Uncharacterized protein n=1 Tax=Novipirellula herctigrandis TaxID=2527986 RepID=A0A5C5YXH9_9BACT|nr:hypothetical protein CA13_08770 [Planctomycetes bacterium CA13]